MDTPPKKRRFWQIHLSTAMFLSVSAGLFLWPNTSWTLLQIRIYDSKEDMEMMGRTSPYEEHQEGRGWPLMFQFRPNYHFSQWEPLCLVFDIVAGIAILVTVAFVCEWLIRRREGRKP